MKLDFDDLLSLSFVALAGINLIFSVIDANKGVDSSLSILKLLGWIIVYELHNLRSEVKKKG